jgi:hypothetical protein
MLLCCPFCPQQLSGCMLICRPLPLADETDHRGSICLCMSALHAHRKSSATTCCAALQASWFPIPLSVPPALRYAFHSVFPLSLLQMKELVEKIKCPIAVTPLLKGWLARQSTAQLLRATCAQQLTIDAAVGCVAESQVTTQSQGGKEKRHNVKWRRRRCFLDLFLCSSLLLILLLSLPLIWLTYLYFV